MFETGPDTLRPVVTQDVLTTLRTRRTEQIDTRERSFFWISKDLFPPALQDQGISRHQESQDGVPNLEVVGVPSCSTHWMGRATQPNSM